MRKFAVFTVMLTLLMSVLVPHAFAGGAGIFDPWYSDANDIGYWPSSSHTWVYAQTSDFGTKYGGRYTEFYNYAKNAVNAWDTAITNHSMTEKSSEPVDQRVIASTRKDADGLYLDKSAAGVTITRGRTYIDSGNAKNGNIVYLYEITKMDILYILGPLTADGKVVDIGVPSNFSAAQWQRVATHEQGHAIGYLTESDQPDSLMWGVLDITNKTPSSAITAKDKAHMRNVYDIQ